MSYHKILSGEEVKKVSYMYDYHTLDLTLSMLRHKIQYLETIFAFGNNLKLRESDESIVLLIIYTNTGIRDIDIQRLQLLNFDLVKLLKCYH